LEASSTSLTDGHGFGFGTKVGLSGLVGGKDKR
jgi:gamma-glutamyl phosphate reductase